MRSVVGISGRKDGEDVNCYSLRPCPRLAAKIAEHLSYKLLATLPFGSFRRYMPPFFWQAFSSSFALGSKNISNE
jgi:hypothetical protein